MFPENWENLVQPAGASRFSWSPRMTRKQLENCTKKELMDLARSKGVSGWHGMRKEELVDALLTLPKKRKTVAARQPVARATATKTRTRPQRTAARNGNGS